MIEHLVILVIEAMARKERAEQQVSLDAVVADLDRLHSDPAAALTDQDVVIPPARHGPLSLLVGVAMGIIMCAALLATFAVVRPHLPLPKPVPSVMKIKSFIPFAPPKYISPNAAAFASLVSTAGTFNCSSKYIASGIIPFHFKLGANSIVPLK